MIDTWTELLAGLPLHALRALTWGPCARLLCLDDFPQVKSTSAATIWSTWWFHSLVMLLLVGIAFTAHRLRIRQAQARCRELERESQQKADELARAEGLLARETSIRMQAEAALARKTADEAAGADRARLAQDLHDAVTQTLFSVSLISETLPAIWESDQAEGQRLLSELRQLSRGAMAEMRALLLALRPASLAGANLGDLLRQLADAFAGRTGASITVSAKLHQPLPADVRIAFYSIAQEALSNIAKHARASQVELSLSRVAAPSAIDKTPTSRVELRVCDNGRGFDPNTVQPGHHGLSFIRERASAVGADLTIESRPSQGTEIVVAWEERQ